MGVGFVINSDKNKPMCEKVLVEKQIGSTWVKYFYLIQSLQSCTDPPFNANMSSTEQSSSHGYSFDSISSFLFIVTLCYLVGIKKARTSQRQGEFIPSASTY